MRIQLLKQLPVMLFLMIFMGILLTGCADKELYTLRDQGVKAYQAGDYQTAKECFDQALSHGNGQVADVEFDILKYRAECELRLKDYEAAQDTYRILMELDDSEDGKNLYAELQEQFSRVHKISEGVELMNNGSYEEAYGIMDELAGLGGDMLSAAAWFNKAVCAEYMGNWDGATELFADYLSIYPNDEDARKEYDFCVTR